MSWDVREGRRGETLVRLGISHNWMNGKKYSVRGGFSPYLCRYKEKGDRSLFKVTCSYIYVTGLQMLITSTHVNILDLVLIGRSTN